MMKAHTNHRTLTQQEALPKTMGFLEYQVSLAAGGAKEGFQPGRSRSDLPTGRSHLNKTRM